MENLLADIRYALRQFRLSPLFALTAILTLALGIGGTTAIFTLIHAIMLRSLPVADPASLFRIGDGSNCCVQGGPQDKWGMFTFPFYQRLQQATPEFEQLAAFQSAPRQQGVRRAKVERIARPLRTEFVTGNYFSTFGVGSFAGRVISPSDDRPSAPPVAVLSYRTWQNVYGADPSVIGSSFVVEDHPFTVVGIAAPGFFGETLRGDPPELWLPLQQEPLLNGPASLLHQSVSAWLRVIGRARPSAEMASVGPRLTVVLRQWLKHDAGYPAAWMPDIMRMLPKQVINVVPAGSGVAQMKESFTYSLQVLFAICSVVLLIACANVANLMLARASARRSQTAVRMAIGASRRRIVVQSLTECVALSVAGGIAGLIVANVATRILLNLAFHDNHSLAISPNPSLPVLAFAFALSLFTGVLFGTAPAWFATSADPVEALRGVNRSTRDGSSFSRQALLVGQATLSVILVAGAVLLTRSLRNLESQRFGFETRNRIELNLKSPPATYSPDRLDALYRSLQERLGHIPGVEHAELALYNPLTDNWGELILVAGHAVPRFSEDMSASWDRLTPGYFQALGQPLTRGRFFTERDNATAPNVAVVNESFVRRFLPHEDPLDKHFGIDLPANANTYRIIGVVRDAKYTDPGGPIRPMFFVPLIQHVNYPLEILQKIELRSHFVGGALIVSRLSPGVLEPLMKKALSETDPNLSIIGVRTLQDAVDMNFDQQRSVATLAGIFGVVALLLAAVGLYGVTAYAVAQRTSEIGVRMALGANRSNVMNLILRGAFQKVLLGLALGIPLAVGAGHVIASKLYNVATWDPVALSFAVVSLALCAFAAALIPATRAASIDPMKALRTE